MVKGYRILEQQYVQAYAYHDLGEYNIAVVRRKLARE